MSLDAIRWALEQPVDKSSAKFVLVAMADCVNAEGGDMVCWPSTQHIAETTSQDRKTVLDGIKRLRDAGFIEDTGARRGLTGQVHVYRLKSPENGPVKQGAEPGQGATTATPKSTENGTGPENGTVPDFPSKGPVFPYEESRFSLETVPKTGHGTRNGTSKGIRKEPGSDARAPSIPGVPDGLLNDWLAVRKAKKAGPLTETAIAGLVREADKAGITAEQAITFCCEAGWQGFNAGWYSERQGKGQGKGAPGAGLNKQEALEASNREVARRWAERNTDATA